MRPKKIKPSKASPTYFVKQIQSNYMKTKKINAALQRKINTINEMIPRINSLEELPITYDGGTYPYYIDILNIKVKNQFVYIETNKGFNIMQFDKRYCVNNAKQLEELKYSLSLIIKTFKKTIKNNQ